MPALQQSETASGTAPRSSEKGPSPVTDSLAKLEDGGSPAGTPAPSLQAPPDGGWEAWSTVLAGWLILFCTFGYTNSFGIFESYYVGALGKSASEIAWIGSFQLWLQFSIGLIVGRAFDDGYGKALVIGGAAFYIICIFLTSLCKEYWQVFLAQGLGVGLGLGVLFLSAISVLPQWFQRKRVLAIGIVMSGSGVGGVGFPIMLNKLIEHHNYAYAVRTSGYLIIGLLIIACALMRFRVSGRKKRPAHLQVPTSNFRSIIRHKTY
ncbi:major facilitator superfamily domain-containing protein, partial [Auriculariales sp. MPI-PUGE-AT-0066]